MVTCLNGGRCRNYDANTCDCSTAPGWTGTYCDVPVCSPNCNGSRTCIYPNKCGYANVAFPVTEDANLNSYTPDSNDADSWNNVVTENYPARRNLIRVA